MTDSPPASVISHRLRKIIAARDLRPAEVERQLIARNAVVSQGSIYRWLGGQHAPRPEVLAALAMVLGVNTDILLGRHQVVWSGMPTGQLSGYCSDCKRHYALEGNCHPDEDFARFQLMHWGIPA